MNPPPAQHEGPRATVKRLRENRVRDGRRRVAALIFIATAMISAAVVAMAFTFADTERGAVSSGRTPPTSAAVAPPQQATAVTILSDRPRPHQAAGTAPSGAAVKPAEDALRAGAVTRPPAIIAMSHSTRRAPATENPPVANPQAPAAENPRVAAPPVIVVIDPGHQARGNPELEPIGPGSHEMKARVSSGTAGVVTGLSESALVLAVGLRLRDALAAAGVKVVMTRTSQEVDVSNSERAQIANRAGAHLFVRIHADGARDPSIRGIRVLYPAGIKGWTDDIAADSRRAAEIVQRHLVAATGATDLGITARSDITGFNWSDVPVVLPEIGFMTNPDEDRLLATPVYQDKIVTALARSVLEYLGAR